MVIPRNRRASLVCLNLLSFMGVALVVLPLNVFWLYQSTIRILSQFEDGIYDINLLNDAKAEEEVSGWEGVDGASHRMAAFEGTRKTIRKSSSAELVSNSDSFSACLLIKDDNNILNEWIAYHYHVLKLRYLVVAVDPSSETSPASIFDTWRNETDLEILELADPDYLPESFLKRGYHIPPQFVNGDANQSQWHEGDEDLETVIADTVRINNHRYRQLSFLASCLWYTKKQDRTWAIHIDTDEYVVVNPNLRMHENTPSVGQPSSILSALQGMNDLEKSKGQPSISCLSMPRLLFGSVEEEELSSAPTGFNATSFETLRWVHHAAYDDKERNGFPKVIVDVSKVPDHDVMFNPREDIASIHRPSWGHCPSIHAPSIDAARSYPFTVNHYLGSRERYFSRNDTRRSERTYNFKAHVNEGTDRWITSWLDGFVAEHGAEKAWILLRDHSVAESVQQ